MTSDILFKLFILILLAVPAGFIVLMIATIVKGAPFMVSGGNAVKKIIKLSNLKSGQKAADLGSGDGRIVIALAKAGAIAHGYEINPILVWWSRRKIKKEGLEGRAFVHQKSFWNADFSSFDLISIYGIDYIMRDLQEKLQRELKVGAKVAANAFEFPDWEYSKKEGSIYFYEKNESVDNF